MRGLHLLHPETRAKAERVQALCRERGLPVLITETWRTEDEQNALYAQGRTAPGRVVTKAAYPYSMHCWGLAFDFCRNIKGREFDEAENFFEQVGEIGQSAGLVWGGAWKDRPHFEDRTISGKVTEVVKFYGTPETFRSTWQSSEKSQ